MNRNSAILILSALAFAALVCTVYVLSQNPVPKGDSTGRQSSNLPSMKLNKQSDYVSEPTKTREAPPNSPQKEISVKVARDQTTSDETLPSYGSTQMARAFSGEISVTEALKDISTKENLGYSEFMKNMFLWKELCAAHNTGENLIQNGGDPDSKDDQTKIAAFCKNFPDDFSCEFSEFAFTAMEEISAGTNKTRELWSAIKKQGTQRALQHAVSELSRMLYAGDYAGVQEVSVQTRPFFPSRVRPDSLSVHFHDRRIDHECFGRQADSAFGG